MRLFCAEEGIFRSFHDCALSRCRQSSTFSPISRNSLFLPSNTTTTTITFTFTFLLPFLTTVFNNKSLTNSVGNERASLLLTCHYSNTQSPLQISVALINHRHRQHHHIMPTTAAVTVGIAGGSGAGKVRLICR